MDISIITPLYKGKKYIDNIIGMISRNEGEYSREIIFINDDPGEEIVVPQEKDGVKIVFFQNEKNMGIHRSRINGLEKANGKWILFLDQDDEIEENYFQSQLYSVREECAIMCNGTWRNGEKIFSVSNDNRTMSSLDDYIKYGYPLVSPGQLLIQKEKIPRSWKDAAFLHNGCDDLFLWIMMMQASVKVVYNEKVLYRHNENGENASFDYGEMADSIAECITQIEGQKEVTGFYKNEIQKRLNSKKDKYTEYQSIQSMAGTLPRGILSKLFEKKGWSSVAVYGIGIFGRRLIDQFKAEGISVSYCIDKRSDVKEASFNIVTLDDIAEKVDIVVITVYDEKGGIRDILKKQYCLDSVYIKDLYKTAMYGDC